MKIVVAYKWAADYQEASVSPAGDVDWGRAKPVVSDYDAVAIAVARQLAQATSGEVIGLSAGSAATAAPLATKTALARGLDRAVIVVDDDLGGAGTARLGDVLAHAVEYIGDVDLVLTGDSSIDVAAKMVSSVLAGRLSCSALAEVSAISAQPDGTLLVERVIPGGTETLAVAGPAVIAVASDALVPSAPGMRDILAAGKKPVETLDLAAIGASADAVPYTVRATARPTRAARKRHLIDTSEPAAAAGELVGILRDNGAL